jgi:proline dehydrogenase
MKFNDTRTAFAYKTDRELRLAHFLFSVIKYPLMVKISQAMIRFALFIRFPIKWAVKPTVYKHFCGGEAIRDCKGLGQKMAKHGVLSVLDYSAEHQSSDEAIGDVLKETLRTIDNAAQSPNVPFAVFKPTAFGQVDALEQYSLGKMSNRDEAEFNKYRQRIETLCRHAWELDTPIMIDAEDSWYQKAIDDVARLMSEKYNREKAIVYNTLQMYQHDRLAFLEQAHTDALEKNYYLGIKFVRGAYMEKERERAVEKGYPSPIYPDKEATDRAYNEALSYSIRRIGRISVFNATHNEHSSGYMTELMEKEGLEKHDSRCWYSQLLGMSDHISFALGKAGYNVAKYVPYGPVRNVMPYLLRRAQENTSTSGQMGRELFLITSEIKRHKQAKKEKQ